MSCSGYSSSFMTATLERQTNPEIVEVMADRDPGDENGAFAWMTIIKQRWRSGGYTFVLQWTSNGWRWWWGHHFHANLQFYSSNQPYIHSFYSQNILIINLNFPFAKMDQFSYLMNAEQSSYTFLWCSTSWGNINIFSSGHIMFMM